MTQTVPPPSTSAALTQSKPPAPDRDTTTTRIIAGATVATALAAILAAAFGPLAAYGFVGVMFSLVLLATAAQTPIFATYAYLVTMPFTAGIDRDKLIPLIRPNEALLVLLLGGAMLGAYLRILRGDDVRPRFYPLVDVPLAVFLLMATIWPLASLTLRGSAPSGTDFAQTLPFIKLVMLYFLVRYTVTNEHEILRCIRFIVWPGAVVALIAILQTLRFPPVIALLETFWSSSDNSAAAAALGERGSATLGSPIATGDVIIISLILVFCCGARGLLGRRERLVLAMTLGAGTLAAGQFSTWIAALLAGGLLAWRFPNLRRQASRFAPLFGVALVVGAPAFIGRLQSIGEYGGYAPESWLGRYDNLKYMFLPHFNWVTTFMGVSPNPVLDAPEKWRTVIYLESGILWFLWVGGVPLLAAFIWLSLRVLRAVRPAIRHPGAFGATASCLEIVWLFLLVLTVIDPHLQQRGTGDLVFTLLAITVGGIDARRRA
ncbi:MAG: hypothetical protein JO100_09295 [Pseudonocardia sp.]|nr:hypothetical protein [Pseudonocardia sp.]